jgi:membrane fusion protein (multidrug efflux system)
MSAIADVTARSEFDRAQPLVPSTGLSARLRRLPKRALLAIGLATAAMLSGAAWIALPASTVSTDDAYVKADSTIVAPKVQGLIARVLVTDNQTVRAGQPLIEIDSEDYRQAQSSAEADVANAKAALAEDQAQEALAAANVSAAAASIRSADAEAARAAADGRRYASLGAAGDVSKSLADQMRATALTAAADADKSRAAYAANLSQQQAVLRTRAQLEAGLAKATAAALLAKQNLGHTVVRAPVSGVIGDRHAQVGEYAQAGTQLLTIVPMNTVYITANFKETQTTRMLAGQHARIQIDALPDRSFAGTVESFAPASGSEFALLPFEPATGNFTRIVQRVPVRIRLDTNQPQVQRLRPGLSADVTVSLAD